MDERLYQPHFTCIFGEKYGNAFNFNQIDSLVWPIFIDIEKSQELKHLLKLKNSCNRNLFYVRKISLGDLLVELKCSDIGLALVRGMALNRYYGVTNYIVANAVKKKPNFFKAILSYPLEN